LVLIVNSGLRPMKIEEIIFFVEEDQEE